MVLHSVRIYTNKNNFINKVFLYYKSFYSRSEVMYYRKGLSFKPLDKCYEVKKNSQVLVSCFKIKFKQKDCP